jgi:hypothetical protein
MWESLISTVQWIVPTKSDLIVSDFHSDWNDSFKACLPNYSVKKRYWVPPDIQYIIMWTCKSAAGMFQLHSLPVQVQVLYPKVRVLEYNTEVLRPRQIGQNIPITITAAPAMAKNNPKER